MASTRGVAVILAFVGIAVACGGDDDKVPPDPGTGGKASSSGGSGGEAGAATGASGGEGGVAGAAGQPGSGGAGGQGGTPDGGVSSGGTDAGRGGAEGGAPSGGVSSGGTSTGGVAGGEGGQSGGSGGTGGGSSCGPCEGVCTSTGECVECVESTDCAAPKAVCDTSANVCVECLPSDDTCPTGSYCTSTFVCEAGCKTGTDCASGVCASTHECESCVADTECATGRVCGVSGCQDPCTLQSQCGNTLECCTSHCADTTWDIAHCGGCGMACDEDQFCGANGCAAAVVSGLCDKPSAVLLLDGFDPDEAAVRVIGNALATGCSPATTVREVATTSATVINPETGQPLLGPELLVTAGGDAVHPVVDYLETRGNSLVYNTVEDTAYSFFVRGETVPIVIAMEDELTESHDYFLLQVVRDPITGTATLVAYGFLEEGTGAAAYFFANVVMPSLSTFTDSYYVVEFTDATADGPSGDDTFTVIASGP